MPINIPRLAEKVAATTMSVSFSCGAAGPRRAMAPSVLRFLDHTRRFTTVGRNPLGEWSASRIDFYLTTQNTRNRQTSMPPAEFEPTISAVEWPQIYASDRASNWTSVMSVTVDITTNLWWETEYQIYVCRETCLDRTERVWGS